MKQENLDKIIAFRHVLHEHPELSNHEVHTRKLIKEFIAQNMSKYVVLHEAISSYKEDNCIARGP